MLILGSLISFPGDILFWYIQHQPKRKARKTDIIKTAGDPGQLHVSFILSVLPSPKQQITKVLPYLPWGELRMSFIIAKLLHWGLLQLMTLSPVKTQMFLRIQICNSFWSALSLWGGLPIRILIVQPGESLLDRYELASSGLETRLSLFG